jgi:hypothetical protein
MLYSDKKGTLNNTRSCASTEGKDELNEEFYSNPCECKLSHSDKLMKKPCLEL